jgi:hypothetical protein
MYYNKTLGDITSLTISDTYKATCNMDELPEVSVQLADKLEADKMIMEFEDDSGDSMHAADAIYNKYPELHIFRP